MSKNKGNRSSVFLLAFLYLYLLLISAVSPVFAQTNPVKQTPIVAEEQDYAFALGLYQDGVYQIAEEQFGKFLEHYPASLKRIDALFLQNECRYFQGKYDSAIQGFLEFLRQYPQSKFTGDAQFRLGSSYLKVKKSIEAISCFKIVLDQFGDSDLAGEAAYWIGEGCLQLQDYDNAIKYYSLAYENYPKNHLRDYALYSVGWTYEKKLDYAKATDWYGRFLKEFPESSISASAKVRIGECYYYARDYQHAIDVLTKSRTTIVQDAERGQADYLIAEAYYQLGNYPEAQKRYETFLKEYRGHKLEREVTFALGWAYLKQDKFTEAAKTFNQNANGSDDLAYASLYRRSVAEKLAGNRTVAIVTLEDLVARDLKGEYTDNALFDLGVMAYEDKKIEDAKKDFQKVAVDFPQSDVLADTYMMLGECLVAESDFNSAETWFEKAASNASASFDVRLNSSYQVAWCLYKMKLFRESSEKFAAFINAYPKHPKAVEAQFWKAEAEYRIGAYDDALNGYKLTVASGNVEKREQAMYGIGWSYFKLGDYKQAIDAFEKLIASYPDGSMSLDARMRLGDAYFELKDYIRAEGSYRVVIRLFPKYNGIDYAWYQLGQALFRQKDYNEAYKQFESLIKTFPGSDLADDAQYALGWINFQRKEFTDAIKEFQSLMSSYPNSELVPRALYSTGDAYYNLKNYNESVKSYRELVSRYPKSSYVADAMNGIQYCLVAEGKPNDAAHVMDGYIKANPGSTITEDLLLKKGDIAFGQGDYDAAEREYREFVSKYPKSKNLSTALYWIAKCLRARNNLSEAATTLESVVATDNAQPATVSRSLYELAEIYTAQKQYDKAFVALTRIAKEFRDSEIYPDALCLMGELYVENGNLSDAKDEFESVVSRFPSSSAAAKAKLGLIRIDIEKKDYAGAQGLANEIATTRTDEIGAEAQYLSGMAHSGAKDWKNAITALLRVKYVFPSYDRWVAKSFVALGDAYIATQDSRRAKTSYQDALKFKQQTETAEVAQKRLSDLQKP